MQDSSVLCLRGQSEILSDWSRLNSASRSGRDEIKIQAKYVEISGEIFSDGGSIPPTSILGMRNQKEYDKK